MSSRRNISVYIECARWIQSYLRERGTAPTLREMADAWELPLSSTHRRLAYMRRVGLAARIPGCYQSTRAFPPDPAGDRVAYFELIPAATENQVRTTELRLILAP